MVTQASKYSVEPHLCSEAQHAQPTGGGAKAPQPSGGLLPKGKSAFASQLLPRILRFRDAPAYLGMDRNRFNAEVRPHLTEISIGTQGVGFDRLELDAWLDEYIARNGRPARKGANTWDANISPVSSCGPESGTSTSASAGGEFARALERVTSKRRNTSSRKSCNKPVKP